VLGVVLHRCVCVRVCVCVCACACACVRMCVCVCVHANMTAQRTCDTKEHRVPNAVYITYIHTYIHTYIRI